MIDTITETTVMLQACKKQIAILSGFKTNPSKSVEHLEFRFDESRRIVVDVEVTTADAAGWDIHYNINEVCEYDIVCNLTYLLICALLYTFKIVVG